MKHTSERKTTPKRHMSIHVKAKLKCNLLENKRELHSENAKIIKPFKCQFCIDRCFKQKKNLTYHIKKCHANKLKFLCALCPLAIQTSADPIGGCKHRQV